MYKINEHPIIEVEEREKISFLYEGEEVIGEKNFTIAAALHQAGHPVHSHRENRKRKNQEKKPGTNLHSYSFEIICRTCHQVADFFSIIIYRIQLLEFFKKIISEIKLHAPRCTMYEKTHEEK